MRNGLLCRIFQHCTPALSGAWLHGVVRGIHAAVALQSAAWRQHCTWAGCCASWGVLPEQWRRQGRDGVQSGHPHLAACVAPSRRCDGNLLFGLWVLQCG
jgi:hypothetical protein